MEAYSIGAVKNRLTKYWDSETVRGVIEDSSDFELCECLRKAAQNLGNEDDELFALEVQESLPAEEYVVESHPSTDIEEYLEMKTKEVDVSIKDKVVKKIVKAIDFGEMEFPRYNGLIVVCKKGKDWNGHGVQNTHAVFPHNLEAHLEKYEGWEALTLKGWVTL